MAHLATLNSFKYPRLSGVKTRGPGCLTGFQLCFKSGNASQIVFSHENHLAEFDLTGVEEMVRRVVCRVNKNNFGFYLNHMRMEMEDGSERVIFDQSSLGKEFEVQVPKHHVLIGFYGKTTMEGPKRICSLGFIAMDRTELN